MKLEDICAMYDITNYVINPDGSIDVNGDVDLSNMDLDELPCIFNKVSGDFICYDNELTTLAGCPRSLGGDFECDKIWDLLYHTPLLTKASLITYDWFERQYPSEIPLIKKELIKQTIDLL